MAKIAIDVAIIPPDFVLDALININANLLDKSSDNFNLGKKDFLPHITLVMGVVKEESLDEIEKRLNKIAKTHSSLSLSVSKIYSSQKQDNNWSSNSHIDKSPELLKMHEDIITAVEEFLIPESSPDMFYDFPKPENGSNALRFVKEYILTGAFDNFTPHISLGKGKISENTVTNIDLPLQFSGSRLVLSHLGVHCTCRKILFQTILKENLA